VGLHSLLHQRQTTEIAETLPAMQVTSSAVALPGSGSGVFTI
jgi:hypothetical protein